MLLEKLCLKEWIPCFLLEISIFANLKYLVVITDKADGDNFLKGTTDVTNMLEHSAIGLAFFR